MIIKNIQTNFYKHNGDHSQFLFSRGDFSSTQSDELVSRRLHLLEDEECSPCRALRQSELEIIELISKSRNVEGEGQYPCQVGKLHPCSSQDPPIGTQYPPNRTADTASVHVLCAYT